MIPLASLYILVGVCVLILWAARRFDDIPDEESLLTHWSTIVFVILLWPFVMLREIVGLFFNVNLSYPNDKLDDDDEEDEPRAEGEWT